MKTSLKLSVVFFVFGIGHSFAQGTLSNGLVVHLPFDSSSAVEKINNLNVTNQGATLDKGRNGVANSAFRFDGKSNIVVTGAGQKIPQNEITVSFWARGTKISVQSPLILNPDSTTNRFNIHTHYYEGTTHAAYIDYGNIATSRLSTGGFTLDTSAWELYTFISSKAGNVMKIFKNAKMEYSLPKYGNFTKRNNDLMIGGFINQASVNLFYFGLLDDIRIYDRVLSQSEINELYTGTSSISSQRIKDVKIYPNPSNGTFTVDLPDYKINSLSVFNNLGQEMSFTRDGSVITLNNPSLGICYLRIITDNGTLTQKLIITQ